MARVQSNFENTLLGRKNCFLHWVLQYWGRSNTHQHWFAIGLRLGQKFFNLAFCSYLHLQYFNWAAVPGGRISNSPTSQSPIVVGKARRAVK
jgi:hypothetical protein